MPMGTASYLSGSSPRITDAAEASETSCSPLRPPNRTPTRRIFLSGVTFHIFPEKRHGQKLVSVRGFHDVGPAARPVPVNAGPGLSGSCLNAAGRKPEYSSSNLEWAA